MGLAFLTAGRYFLVNNGPYYQNYDVPNDPEKDNWNLFFHKGPARTWITRSTYGYDKWIPAELFLTHYFPDDPEESQIMGIACRDYIKGYRKGFSARFAWRGGGIKYFWLGK